MAGRSNNGAEPPHSIWPVVLSGERALKCAGERNTRNQVDAGTFGKPPARGTLGVSTSDIQRRLGAAGGFPCRQIADRVVGRAASPLAARCAHAVLADHNLNIIYYIRSFRSKPRLWSCCSPYLATRFICLSFFLGYALVSAWWAWLCLVPWSASILTSASLRSTCGAGV
jgi:hypothetical protein